jgi:hypothetical protein
MKQMNNCTNKKRNNGNKLRYILIYINNCVAFAADSIKGMPGNNRHDRYKSAKRLIEKCNKELQIT